jgi:hypothetical protein
MRPGVIFLCLFSLFAALMAFSCNKDSIFAPFEGILETDEEANILGGDAGDWCYDTNQPIVNTSLHPDIGSFSLPCSTFGDSAQIEITMTSTYLRSIQVTASSSDTSLKIYPDSVELSANSQQIFTAWFYLTGDSVHSGNISFLSDTEDSLKRVGFQAGFVTYYTDIWDIPVVLPTEYSLYPAFPNPATDVTHIGIGMPRNGHVILKIYNSDEELSATLLDSQLMPGTYMVNWDVSDITPGIYKAYIEIGDFTCQGDIEVR